MGSAVKGTSVYLGDRFTAGTLDETGNKLYGDGFLSGVLGTGSYVILTGTTVRNEDECAMFAMEVTQDLLSASIRWAAGNVFIVSVVDEAGGAENGVVTFAVEDA